MIYACVLIEITVTYKTCFINFHLMIYDLSHPLTLLYLVIWHLPHNMKAIWNPEYSIVFVYNEPHIQSWWIVFGMKIGWQWLHVFKCDVLSIVLQFSLWLYNDKLNVCTSYNTVSRCEMVALRKKRDIAFVPTKLMSSARANRKQCQWVTMCSMWANDTSACLS